MSDNETTAAGWYEATRVASPQRPRLNFDLDVDVCVIGAGLAGLTVAREIARRGWSVAVLEANRVALAASGRNTGFVLPGFGESADNIVERVGLDHAKELWALSEQGVDYVRRAIEKTGMPGVDPVDGWLHVSKTDNDKAIRNEVERLRWIGANVEYWPTERVRDVLPNPRYFNALYFPGALAYPSAELRARACRRRGGDTAHASSKRRRSTRSIPPACASASKRKAAAYARRTWCWPAMCCSAT